jgi:hypothetical protein
MTIKPYRTIPRNFVFTCSFCGKPLTPSNNQKSRFEHFLNIYCSDACCNKNNRAKDAENRKLRKECGITGVSPKEKERLRQKYLELKGVNDYG